MRTLTKLTKLSQFPILRILTILPKLIILLLLSPIANAQYESTTPAKSPGLTLGIVLPDPTADLPADQVQRLEAKLANIVNSTNEAIVGYYNDIVLYPVLTVEDVSIVEGGMENMTVATLECNLFIKQISTRIVFNSLTRRIKGSGKNRQQAIANALTQLRPSDNVYATFISAAKNKIITYYNENCSSIIRNADNLAARQDFEQAIALLQSIPTNACSAQADKKSLEYYRRYQTTLCSRNITKAKGAIAVNDYTTALESLQEIDRESPCYPEVSKLINQISTKVTRAQNQELSLEEQRINAMKEVAKAYYGRTVHQTTYNVLAL